MKARALVLTVIHVLAVLIIIGGCATTTKTQVEGEGVNQEVFIWTVRFGDYAEVKRLIEEGADVNAKDYNDYTVLMSASYDGHREIAKLLIEEGADVNAQCKLGYTALIEASVKGHVDIVKLLVEARADVNVQDNAGHTALWFASTFGHTEVAQLLTNAGAKE